MEYLFIFLFGGFLMTLIKYLADNIDPDYAGIIAAFPVAIISTLFIQKNKLSSYLISYIRSIFILFLSGIVYYLFIIHNYSKHYSLFSTLFIWLTINIIYVLYLK